MHKTLKINLGQILGFEANHAGWSFVMGIDSLLVSGLTFELDK